MKQDKILYGNVTLSQIAHFLVDVCGKDALLSGNYLTDSELNDAYKEKGSYLKFRFTDENSIFGKIRQFFSDLEDEFGIPKFKSTQKASLDGKKFEETEQSDFQYFYQFIVWHCIIHIAGTRPFENTQNNLTKKSIATWLLYPENEMLQEYIALWSDSSFTEIFSEFTSHSGKTMEEIYIMVSEKLEISENDPYQHIKRSLERCKKENKNPKWEIFHALLKVVYTVKKEYANIFLNMYFYANFRNALAHISLKKQDWRGLEDFCKSYEPELVHDFIEKFVNMTALKSINKSADYFDSLTARNCREAISQFQRDYNDLKMQLPHSLPFFENWFCGKDFVLKYLDSGDLEELEAAVKWYLKALRQGKYFAGKSLEPFIHEAVAVSVYFDYTKNPAQARTRIAKNSDASSDTKTSLDKNTKEFYDFGLTFDLFLNEKEDASQLFYHAPENFWRKFQPESEKARKLHGKDCLRHTEINPTEKDSVHKSREYLLEISDSKINDILPTTHDVAYTPLCNAIVQRFYDVVEQYLDQSCYPSLDVNKPSTNNCYPIHEILTKCKGFQTGMPVPITSIKKREKELFFKILDRTEKQVLFTETNRSRLSPLQTAIETLDKEIASALVDKMVGKDYFPSDYKISADMVSPLYYAIEYKYKILHFSQCLEKKEISVSNPATLFRPGFSASEKKESLGHDMESDFHNILLQLQTNALSQKDIQELNAKINSIIEVLISKTQDVDEFILWSPNTLIKQEQGFTALLFACEWNDTIVCRKLIEAGADITKAVGKCPNLNGLGLYTPNNFLYRAIHFKSWDCLEMVLTEYKGRISSQMHCGEVQMTPLVCFLLNVQTMEFTEAQYLRERFIPLFLSAGASLDEPTILGSAGEILTAH